MDDDPISGPERVQLKQIKKMMPILWLMFRLDRAIEVKDVVEHLHLHRETASNYLKALADPKLGLIARPPGKKRGYILTRGRNLITPGGHQWTLEAELNTIEIAEIPAFQSEIAEIPAFQPLRELSKLNTLNSNDRNISLNLLKNEIAEIPAFQSEIAEIPAFQRPRTRWIMWHGKPRRLYKCQDGEEIWLDDDGEEDAALQTQHANLLRNGVYRHLADKIITDYCSVEIALALEVYAWAKAENLAKHPGFLVNFLYKKWFIPYNFRTPNWPEEPPTTEAETQNQCECSCHHKLPY